MLGKFNKLGADLSEIQVISLQSSISLLRRGFCVIEGSGKPLPEGPIVENTGWGRSLREIC